MINKFIVCIFIFVIINSKIHSQTEIENSMQQAWQLDSFGILGVRYVLLWGIDEIFQNKETQIGLKKQDLVDFLGQPLYQEEIGCTQFLYYILLTASPNETSTQDIPQTILLYTVKFAYEENTKHYEGAYPLHINDHEPNDIDFWYELIAKKYSQK